MLRPYSINYYRLFYSCSLGHGKGESAEQLLPSHAPTKMAKSIQRKKVIAIKPETQNAVLPASRTTQHFGFQV